MSFLLPSPAPLPARDRLAWLDALRGAALFGVILINVASMVMRFNARAVFAHADLLDHVLVAAQTMLVMGKARALFAFLFGIGVALMLRRAQWELADFRGLHLRRMAALLAIGMAHQSLFFWGDILVTYALLGAIALATRDWSDRALLRVALALLIAPPLLLALTTLWLGAPPPPLLPIDRAADAARGLAAVTSADWLDYVRYIRFDTLRDQAQQTWHMLVYQADVLGLFLLGQWTVRRGIVDDPASHRPLLRRVARWGIGGGLVLAPIAALPFIGVRAHGAVEAAVQAAFVGVPLLGLGYAAALTPLLLRSPAARAWLAPAGRMALTNYLASSLIAGLALHGYGLGLLRSMGPTSMTLLAVGIFGALLAFSHLWLRRFRMGPAEWLWRSLSYGAAQPLRRRSTRWSAPSAATDPAPLRAPPVRRC